MGSKNGVAEGAIDSAFCDLFACPAIHEVYPLSDVLCCHSFLGAT